MARISSKSWKRYSAVQSRLKNKATELMLAYIREHGFDDWDELLDYAYSLATIYGEAAATAACEMYESVAARSGKRLPAAEPAETATFGETAKAVRGAAKQSPEQAASAVGRLVKQAGEDTTLQNAARDGAQFAWIPQGDSCPFCLMLASNGWQYMSKDALEYGHAEHIHANCDCEYAIRFDSRTNVAGYNPEALKERFDAAEGDTWREKLNSLQQERYAENKDAINARRRELYAERVEQEKGLARSGSHDKIDKTEMVSLSSHNMHNTSDVLYERVGHVPPIPGYDDVFLHGDAWGVSTRNADGVEVSIPNSEFIKTLKALDLENGALRLCVCSAGAEDRGLANYVAREMNMPVMAATTDVWISIPDKHGISMMVLYENDGEDRPNKSKPGHWRLFYPDGRIKETLS